MNKNAHAFLESLTKSGVITQQMATDCTFLDAHQVIPRLLENDISPIEIAKSVASVLQMPLLDSSNDSVIVEESPDFTVSGTLAYLVNPFDSHLYSDLASQNDITGCGVKVHEVGDYTVDASDILNDDLSEQEATSIVDTIIEYAVSQNASDLHIEPDHDRVSVRIRVDGKLETVPKVHIKHNGYYSIANSLLDRADLTTGDYINPKDGEFIWKSEKLKTKVQIRLSMVPAAIDGSIVLKETNYPGTFVLRIAGQNKALTDIDKLGLSEYQVNELKHVLKAPHGLFLVTGPTGSGKTTTLYAALRYLQKIRPQWAFRTAENPVEMNLRGITQTQINKQAGATFEKVLRALLRQDPDIILVGEIRDEETLNTAMDAAMTGHFVMGTLHANGAIPAIQRFIRMGAEPEMFADVLVATSAQRVIPKLCQKCSTSISTDEAISETEAKSLLISHGVEMMRIANTEGCSHCKNGYTGRQMIAEINRPHLKQKEIISVNGSLIQISKEAESSGFLNMWGRAVELINEGKIDFSSAESALGEISQHLIHKTPEHIQ